MSRGLGVFLCLVLGLPLAGAGIFCAWVAGREAWDAWSARDWVRVKAEMVPGAWGNVPGEKRAAHFSYAFEGKRYEGRRLSVGSLSDDNIDAWRGNFGEEIANAKAQGRPLSLWVDPDDPARSAFYRDAQWDHIVLFGLLALGIGGAGGLALGTALSLARRRERDGTLPNQTTGAAFFWVFALLWNGVAFLIAFLVLADIIESKEWGGLFVLLFPFVGLFLFWAAMGATTTAIKAGVARVSGRRPQPREQAAPVRGFVDAPMREARGILPNGGDLPAAIATTTQQGGVLTVRFSRRRRLTPALILFAVGGFLTLVGFAMILGEGVGVGTVLLLLVATLVDVSAVAYLVSTLEVRARTGEIAVDKAGLFGRKSWHLRRDSIKAIRPVLSYTVNNEPVFEIRAETQSGEEVLLGDSLRGEAIAGPYAARLAAAAGFPSSLVRAPATAPTAET